MHVNVAACLVLYHGAVLHTLTVVASCALRSRLCTMRPCCGVALDVMGRLATELGPFGSQLTRMRAEMCMLVRCPAVGDRTPAATQALTREVPTHAPTAHHTRPHTFYHLACLCTPPSTSPAALHLSALRHSFSRKRRIYRHFFGRSCSFRGPFGPRMGGGGAGGLRA
jgi:hypothetical protein